MGTERKVAQGGMMGWKVHETSGAGVWTSGFESQLCRVLAAWPRHVDYTLQGLFAHLKHSLITAPAWQGCREPEARRCISSSAQCLAQSEWWTRQGYDCFITRNKTGSWGCIGREGPQGRERPSLRCQVWEESSEHDIRSSSWFSSPRAGRVWTGILL